jgi:hypothetical protein
VGQATRGEWRIPVLQSLSLIACMIYAHYVTGRPLANAVDVMRFLSKLASAIGAEQIDYDRVMRWPKAAADYMIAEVPRLSGWFTRPQVPTQPRQPFWSLGCGGPLG